MAARKRFQIDPFGKRIVNKKAPQRLAKIPKSFAEIRPFLQFQYL